jgi:hypothetical protein
MKSGTTWWATLTTWALSLFLRLGMALTSTIRIVVRLRIPESTFLCQLAIRTSTRKWKNPATVNTMAVTFNHSTKSHTQQSCPPIEQLPNAIFYPFRIFQQLRHAHFLKDFERNRNYYVHRRQLWVFHLLSYTQSRWDNRVE